MIVTLHHRPTNTAVVASVETHADDGRTVREATTRALEEALDEMLAKLEAIGS